MAASLWKQWHQEYEMNLPVALKVSLFLDPIPTHIVAFLQYKERASRLATSLGKLLVDKNTARTEALQRLAKVKTHLFPSTTTNNMQLCLDAGTNSVPPSSTHDPTPKAGKSVRVDSFRRYDLHIIIVRFWRPLLVLSLSEWRGGEVGISNPFDDRMDWYEPRRLKGGEYLDHRVSWWVTPHRLNRQKEPIQFGSLFDTDDLF